MHPLQPEKTVRLNRHELLAARDAAALTRAIEGLSAELRADELVPALRAASDWANRAGQWLVVVTPWGIHRLGEVDTGLLRQALRRYADSLADSP